MLDVLRDTSLLPKLLAYSIAHLLICFPGEVLSVERSVAVVRGGARGGPPGARVRVLPLDTQCTVVRECTLRRS